MHLLLLVVMFAYFLLAITNRNFFSARCGAAGNPNFDALLSTTFANYRSKFVDTVSKSFFLFWWLYSKGRKRTENGGESIIIQLMYGKNTTVKSYSGYDTLDVTPQEGLTAAKYPWKQVAGSISISRLEERKNSGEAQIINLLKSKIMQAEISMRDALNTMFFSDGTGNNSNDLYGLQLLVEDGTAWGSLGGIDSSDAANAWWRNQYINISGASWATNGLDKMRTLYNSTSRGNEHPDFGIIDQTGFEYYEKSLVPAERFEDKTVGDAGFGNLRFKGMVLGFDEICPAGFLWMLTSTYIELVIDAMTDMITTDFVRPENQDAKTAQILLMGNLVLSNRARQGLLNNGGSAWVA